MDWFTDPSGDGEDQEAGQGRVRYVAKVAMCGDWAVGKTSLVRRFAENKFDHNYIPSIGLNVVTKIIDLGEGRRLKLNIFDTGGQERFKSMRRRYYRGAQGVIFVFDLTRADTAVSLETRWLPEVESVLSTDFERVVLGNKLDLEPQREVSEYAARQMAERIGAPYFETSALLGRNVQEAFRDLASRLMEKHFSEG